MDLRGISIPSAKGKIAAAVATNRGSRASAASRARRGWAAESVPHESSQDAENRDLRIQSVQFAEALESPACAWKLLVSLSSSLR